MVSIVGIMLIASNSCHFILSILLFNFKNEKEFKYRNFTVKVVYIDLPLNYWTEKFKNSNKK